MGDRLTWIQIALLIHLQSGYRGFSLLFSPNKANLRKEGKAGIVSGNRKQSLLHWDYCPSHGWNRSKFSCAASYHTSTLLHPQVTTFSFCHPSVCATDSCKARDLANGHDWSTAFKDKSGSERVVTPGDNDLRLLINGRCHMSLLIAELPFLSLDEFTAWKWVTAPAFFHPQHFMGCKPVTAVRCQAKFILFCKSESIYNSIYT